MLHGMCAGKAQGAIAVVALMQIRISIFKWDAKPPDRRQATELVRNRGKMSHFMGLSTVRLESKLAPIGKLGRRICFPNYWITDAENAGLKANQKQAVHRLRTQALRVFSQRVSGTVYRQRGNLGIREGFFVTREDEGKSIS